MASDAPNELEHPVEGAPPQEGEQPQPEGQEPQQEGQQPEAQPEPDKPAPRRDSYYVAMLRRQKEQLEQENAALRAAQRQQPGQAIDPAILQQQVAQMRAQERFVEACNRTFEAGRAEYGDGFEQARDTLVQAMGDAINRRPDILEAITELPQGHRVYHALSEDLDQAAEIFQLPPARAAVRLAQLGHKFEGAVPPARAKRPLAPPIEPVSGSTKAEADIYDPKLSMAEFDAAMKRRERERRQAR